MCFAASSYLESSATSSVAEPTDWISRPRPAVVLQAASDSSRADPSDAGVAPLFRRRQELRAALFAAGTRSMAGRPERALLRTENARALCRAAGSGVATRGEPGLLVAHRARVRSFARRSALPQIRPRRLSGTPAPVRCALLNRACAQRGEKWFRARARRSRF